MKMFLLNLQSKQYQEQQNKTKTKKHNLFATYRSTLSRENGIAKTKTATTQKKEEAEKMNVFPIKKKTDYFPHRKMLIREKKTEDFIYIYRLQSNIIY